MRLALLCLVSVVAHANPYPDPSAVPQDGVYRPSAIPVRAIDARALRDGDSEVLRISVVWSEAGEKYEIADTVVEMSGTPSLAIRALKRDELGSYRGQLTTSDGTVLEDSIGTGANYRKLVREMTFRFPKPDRPVKFTFFAENPVTGKEEAVLTKSFTHADFPNLMNATEVEVREIGEPLAPGKLAFNFYADGYLDDRREAFFTAAKKAVDALKKTKFPGEEYFAYRAVFAPSQEKLGKAKDLGMPIPEKNTFLGLFFPYWNNFGRWYNVVYPTRESRYRSALASVPYDYALAILDDGAYWGVGNYRELTAIPANSFQFTYLLTHELGHFFGLNEEYEGGGPTELEFAPNVDEPWSQNITFLRDPKALKWQKHVQAETPIPTPSSKWSSGKYGAYKGGYADSLPKGHSHKPGFSCTMASGSKFCPICHEAIVDRIQFDSAN